MTVHRARREFAACTADALDYVLARNAIDGGLRSELLTALRPRRIRRSTSDAGYTAQTWVSPGHPLEWDAEDAPAIWDSQAALANGFAVVRVNRHGDPDEYGLRRHLVAELHDLTGLSAVLVPPAA